MSDQALDAMLQAEDEAAAEEEARAQDPNTPVIWVEHIHDTHYRVVCPDRNVYDVCDRESGVKIGGILRNFVFPDAVVRYTEELCERCDKREAMGKPCGRCTECDYGKDPNCKFQQWCEQCFTNYEPPEQKSYYTEGYKTAAEQFSEDDKEFVEYLREYGP